MRFRHWSRELFQVGALLFLLGALVWSVRREQTVTRQLGLALPSSLRSQAQDRLIGRQIDVEGLTGTDTPKTHVLWILNLDACHGCLDQVAGWRLLEDVKDLDLSILLMGTRSTDADARLRVLSRTHVLQTDRSTTLSAFGVLLPSTKLLVSPEGVVLLADSRSSGQECGWSFDALVNVLLGHGTSTAIRFLDSRFTLTHSKE
jgi:hypothetical protein